jgi:hypothetical protein
MAEPILNLDTLVERPTIAINGEPYEMRTPGELSLLDFHWVGKQSAALEPLFAQSEPLTLDQIGEIGENLGKLCQFILLAPEEVLKKLHVAHQLQVIQVFTGLLRGLRPTPAEANPAQAPETAPPSTGESTSPAS